jgi:hypothetical protein
MSKIENTCESIAGTRRKTAIPFTRRRNVLRKSAFLNTKWRSEPGRGGEGHLWPAPPVGEAGGSLLLGEQGKGRVGPRLSPNVQHPTSKAQHGQQEPFSPCLSLRGSSLILDKPMKALPAPILSEALRASDIPASFKDWSDIIEFAATFRPQLESNNYLASQGIIDIVPTSTVVEIRAALFLEYRRYNHFGYRPEQKIFEDTVKVIDLLRTKVV